MGSLSSRIRGQGFMFLFVEVVTWVFFTCKVNFEGFQWEVVKEACYGGELKSTLPFWFRHLFLVA